MKTVKAENIMHTTKGQHQDTHIASGISERLAKERRKLGMQQKDAAEIADVSRDMWGRYERGVSMPAAVVLAKFASAGADVRFVLDGVSGPGETGREFVTVPKYDVKAAAGDGLAVLGEEQVSEHAFRRDWFERRGLDPKCCAVIDIAGESGRPLLNPGDSVLIHMLEREPKPERLYVLRVHDDLLVKYVTPMPDGTLQCSSENAVFRPFTVTPEQLEAGDVEIIGRVRSSSRDWD